MAQAETKKVREEARRPLQRISSNSRARTAIQYAHQAERLGQYTLAQENENVGTTQALEAKFITAQDPVIVTAGGGRLPAIPLNEALKLNGLKDRVEGRTPNQTVPVKYGAREAKDGTIHGVKPPEDPAKQQCADAEAPLRQAVPVARTNPLFPPLPMYGPPTFLRNLQCLSFRLSSAVLSFYFLLVIVLGAVFTSVPKIIRMLWKRATFRDPNGWRPCREEELRRKQERLATERQWETANRKKRRRERTSDSPYEAQNGAHTNGFRTCEERYIPTEGGKDPLICDVPYYARRVGLESETYLVQTEDGFIIELWHLYNPLTEGKRPKIHDTPNSPDIFEHLPDIHTIPPKGSKYPVLLIHGLLQSSGAYCCTDEYSLAFWLAKSGLDVWLGNNRCGFQPRHTLLETHDPRMWAWNIRQMGVMDLPALISRVLVETRFPKLALVAHSQGTTQTLVALAKEQRPEIGERISVACLLAPAAYAGPLIGKMYFKFMRVISPGMFRAMFGIHAFIPFLMSMHRILPGRFYGFMGYRVFSFLFNWTDSRWEKDLRNRAFQFAPVYVSAESMRWWLGRECFAKQRCILATREERELEDKEDAEEDFHRHNRRESDSSGGSSSEDGRVSRPARDKGKFAWYDKRVPPFALWVCGSDDLVDGERLLRRFERGREPHVQIVHSTVLPEYEHLDVIWATDAVDRVWVDLRKTIWKTVPSDCWDNCRTPKGCEDVERWVGGGTQL